MPSKQKSILITGSVLLSPYSNYTVSTQGLLKTFHRCSKGGAGNALALEFAARGLRVFATARSLKSLDNLPEKGIETFILDVTNTESIIKLRDEIIKRTGGYLDILFNNAGSMYEAPAIEADDQRVRAMFDANVFGLFTMVSTFTPLLVKAAAGNASPIIVNVASILARIPFPFASAYNASKAAVASYSDTLRLEVSPLGIRVVTVHMGEVSTGLMSSDNIKFGTESIYIDLEEKVKRRSIQHSKASMGPEKFAHEVVSEVLLEKSPNVWKGTNASAVWLLNALGPRNVFDSSLKGAVGLGDSDLIKKVYNQGQRKVSGDWSVWLGADGSGPLPL